MAKRLFPRTRSGRRGGDSQTRGAIMAAAERCFARDGLAGARTEVIAAEARVNKAMLYYYFRSKEQLYQAVLEDHFCEFHERALAVLRRPGPAREILLDYVGLHFDFISARHRYVPLFQQLISAGGPLPRRLVRKYFAPRSQALDALLERGMRNGEFRQMDRFHAAISLLSLIIFYFSAAPVLRMLGRDDAYSAASLQRRKLAVLDFIRHGLLAVQK